MFQVFEPREFRNLEHSMFQGSAFPPRFQGYRLMSGPPGAAQASICSTHIERWIRRKPKIGAINKELALTNVYGDEGGCGFSLRIVGLVAHRLTALRPNLRVRSTPPNVRLVRCSIIRTSQRRESVRRVTQYGDGTGSSTGAHRGGT